MTILHVGKISNNLFNGVCVVVPEYIKHQCELADVGLLNLSNDYIEDIENQYLYSEYDAISNLPEPYSRPDIVVFHEVYKKEFLKIYPQLIKNNIPYVIVPHGSLTQDAQRKKHLKKIVGNLFFYNKFIFSAESLQLLSENEFKNTGFKIGKFISTNGVNNKEICKTNFNTDEVLITYIGRLEMKTKGLDIMMDAFSNIHEFLKANKVSIYIFGPDLKGRYEALEKLIEERKLDDIVFLNHEILGSQKEKQLLNSDYFIQTSRTEGMPTGILEAMSYGLPSIVTEGTSLGNQINKYDAGWVSKTDAESLSKTIKKAIEEKQELSVKSKNAITLCENEFSWQKITKKTIEEYCNILSRRKQ